MNWQRLYRKLRKICGLWLVFGFACTVLLFAFVMEMQSAKSDDLPDLPPTSAPLPIDPQTFATNVAAGDAAEAADQQIMDNARASLSSNTQEKSDMAVDFPTFPPYPTSVPQSGILAHPEFPDGGSYHVANAWDGIVNGNIVMAYAGSKADDPDSGVWDTTQPEQGMLKVEGWGTGNAGRMPSLDGEYLTATRTGALTITAFSGTCLYLVSTGNTNYQFDLATRAWSCMASTQPPP